MKIAILTSGILPVPAVKGGAVENLIDFYLEYNEKYGLHEVTVFSVTDNKYAIPEERRNEKHNHYVQFNTDNFLYRIARKLYSYIHECSYYNYFIDYFLHKSLKQIKKDSYDLIVLESRPWFVVDVMKIVNAPIILHQHNDIPDADLEKFKSMAKGLTGVICVSKYICNRMRSVCRAEICKVVYNGIDTNKFKRKDNRLLMRKRLGIKESDYVIVYSGRLVREKGIKELIEAVSQIEDEEIKLVIIGASFYAESSQNDSFITELRQAATSLGARIIFTGFVKYSDVPAYLSMADLAVVPSLCNEALGLANLEAISVGLPVIATRVGGIPETIEEPNVLIDKNEHFVENLSKAIRTMKESSNDERPALKEEFHKEMYAQNYWKTIETMYNGRLQKP